MMQQESMIENFTYEIVEIRKILRLAHSVSALKNGQITTITTSSLEAKPGSLFIPLRAERDGHTFIAHALSQGATAFMYENNHPILKTLSQDDLKKGIPVENTYKALALVAKSHREKFKVLTIGITGSNGKTTTKELIGTIQNIIPEKHCVVTEKNYNNEIGLPFTIFRLHNESKYAILEMGMNHAGEIGVLSGIARPDIAVITNIGHAHIENLGSTKAIAEAKAEIFNGMPPNGTLVIPQDILHKEILQKMAQDKAIKVVEAGNGSGIAQIKERTENGFLVTIRGLPFSWNFPGDKIVLDVLLAAEALYQAGFSPEMIVQAFGTYTAPKGRMQIHYGKFTIIDDTYNANPDSAYSSMLAAGQIAGGQPVILILGDFKEIGGFSGELHEKTGTLAAQNNIQGVITLGEDSQYINEGYEKEYTKLGQEYLFSRHYTNTEENLPLIEKFIVQNCKENMVILVKGSRSMRMERIVQLLLPHNQFLK